MTESQPTLEELREHVAKVTREIIGLVGERNGLARDIGRIKTRDSLPEENEAVEDELTRQVVAECERTGLEMSVGLKILNILLTESKKVQGVQGRPAPAPIFAKALALQRKGVKLVRLDVGEPDFPPPEAVKQACADAIFSNRTHYTESQGIPELRDALRRYLSKRYRFDVGDGEIAVTPSGRFAIYASLANVVRQGESAIVLEPNWPAYRDALYQLGARAVVVHTTMDEDWTPSVRQIEESIRPSTRAIILNYPNNPSGRVIPERLFREIVELADDRGLTVISDEIYNDYVVGHCPSVLETTPKKFILASSFSKTWAMTGFRIGYAVASKEVMAGITKMISLMFTSVPEFIQWGAIKSLEADREVDRNVTVMRDRVKIACEELSKIDALEFVKPDGGMYVFPMLKRGGPGGSFVERLLTHGVSVVPGSMFGHYEDFFRISLGQPTETIVDGIRRMGEALR